MLVDTISFLIEKTFLVEISKITFVLLNSQFICSDNDKLWPEKTFSSGSRENFKLLFMLVEIISSCLKHFVLINSRN